MAPLPPWVLANYAKSVYSEPTPRIRHRFTTKRRDGEIVYHDLAAHLYWRTPAGGGSIPILAIRGTVPTIFENVARDLQQWPVWHPQLGIGPQGFSEGADALYRAIADIRTAKGSRLLDLSPVIVGHSLGGALAARVAALMLVNGLPAPRQMALFNSPYPGGRKLRGILKKVPNFTHDRHVGDVVSDVESIFFVYVQPVPFNDVGLWTFPLQAHAIGNFTSEGIYRHA